MVPLDTAALQRAVQTALAAPGAVPAGHKAAVLLVANQDTVRAVFAARVGDHWQVAGSLEHPTSHDGALDAGVTVSASW